MTLKRFLSPLTPYVTATLFVQHRFAINVYFSRVWAKISVLSLHESAPVAPATFLRVVVWCRFFVFLPTPHSVLLYRLGDQVAVSNICF
jgi:hypothetical protein